ncbi:methyl-accepting chemotaxis protein [Novimethylophilus kurashikiensis]|uniref:Methyl-accepting chemotaxis protein n=1 Tax=Novimethylophilus kurashikiensis TaxID=1825523 RepID=A0A2R5F402_9PROT|nr:methyl-accepting chemotaxis protein [Novimethylophilus kurashikiensis]GBG13167.1 methyl-accepting chemotaxis protein [Novimethylophilus kurashikiensis]
MSISTRLQVLISSSVLCLVLVGGYALYQLKAVGDNGEYLSENTLPSYQNIYGTMINLQDARALTFKHLLFDDPAVMQEVEHKIQSDKQELLQKLDVYGKKMASEGPERELWATMDRDIKTYLGVIDNVLAISRAGRKAEARDEMVKNLPLLAKASKEVEAVIEYNHKISDQFNLESKHNFTRALWLVPTLILIASLLGIVLGWRIYKSIIGPLNDLKRTVGSIERDLDLTRQAPVIIQDEVGETVTAFNKLTSKLRDTLAQILQNADSVTSSAGGLATSANQLSQSAISQSESTSSMAATVEQMTVGVGHIADRTREANQLAEKSGMLARNGEQVISETVADIHKIAETMKSASDEIHQLETNSEQISAVIQVIREVAEQTNLLALNAAIEAARAGEQGRGFAVVADEVRKLAERTAQSTEEISKSIAAMQASAQRAVSGTQAVALHVNSGVERANEANHAMHEIGESAQQTVQMVSDIALAMQEQSTASTSIAQQVERIAQMTEENSAASQATADTANQLDELAATMQRIIAQFRIR